MGGRAWAWAAGSAAAAGRAWLTVTPIKASSSRTASAAPKSPLARSEARSNTIISTSGTSISSFVSPGSRMYGSFGFGLRLVRMYGASGRLPPEPKPPREPGLCAPQRKQTCFRAKTLIPQSGQVQSPGFGLSSKRMTTGAVPVRAVPVSGRTGVVDTRMASSIPQRSVKRRLDGARRSCVPTERDGRHARNVIEQPTSSIDNKKGPRPGARARTRHCRSDDIITFVTPAPPQPPRKEERVLVLGSSSVHSVGGALSSLEAGRTGPSPASSSCPCPRHPRPPRWPPREARAT